MDEPISRLVGSSRDFSKVWRVPGFDFQHAFTLLPSLEELPSVAGESTDDLERMAGEIQGVLCCFRFCEMFGGLHLFFPSGGKCPSLPTRFDFIGYGKWEDIMKSYISGGGRVYIHPMC